MTRFYRTPFSPLTLLLVSILAGCATTPQNTPTNIEPKPSAQTAPNALAPQPEDDPLLALLTAEIASQRGDYAAATQAYVVAAKSQQDPELARRGVEISLRQNLAEPAYQAAVVWESLAPNNPLASRTVMLLELGTDRIQEALPKLKTYLDEIRAQDQSNPNPNPNGWNAEKTAIELLLRIPDRSKVYNLALELFGNKPQDVDNQVLLGETALYTEQYDFAIQHMQQALQLAPTEQNHLIMARFLEKRDKNPNSAIEHLSTQADEHPDWFNTRLYLARNHTQLEQWPQAKQRFQEMLRIKPAETSLHSSLGFVLSKLKERKAAEHHFKQYLKHTPSQDRQNETLIYLTMADLALAEKDYKSALRTLDSAPNAAKILDIQLKKSDIYEQQGKLKAATTTLNQFQALDENSAVRLFLAKAQQAETRKNQRGAVQILEQGLDRFPKQPDLLYERAMLAERQNDLPALEKHLTELIQVRPDNAHAYNALGYTWADRNIRLDEALTMITKASKLAPNDPFIMDSLGWVYYRTNKLEEAEATLKKAYAIRPDEEIGLHLLEVLQQRGKTEEANTLGQTLKQKHPKSDKLNQLLQAQTPTSTGL